MKLKHEYFHSVVYYESLKREIKTKPIKECRVLMSLRMCAQNVYFVTGLKKARDEGKKCHAKTMKNKIMLFIMNR